jgi:hypothetical protein
MKFSLCRVKSSTPIEQWRQNEWLLASPGFCGDSLLRFVNHGASRCSTRHYFSRRGRRARGNDGLFRLLSKPRFGLIQRKRILVVGDFGTHPSSVSHVHDVEAAMTLSCPAFSRRKPLCSAMRLTRFSCVSHGVAPAPDGLYDQCGGAGRFSRSVADQTVVVFSLVLGIFGEESAKDGRRASRVRPKPSGTTHSARITVSRA